MPDYTIRQFGSVHRGWGLFDGNKGSVTHPSPIYIAAWLDALLRGVTNQSERSLIAKTIYLRPDPSLEERMKHFRVTGTWRPTENPYEREKR
jgi:hypothetical protein